MYGHQRRTICFGASGFPAAHHIISRIEWDFWRSDRARNEIREFYRDNILKTEYDVLPSIRSRIDLIEGEQEVFPGLSVFPAPGHTPGQLGVRLNSMNRELLFVSDAFYHPVQVQRPEWSGIADLDTWHTVKTRIDILNRAVAENTLLMAAHFPFPGLGWVIKYRGGFVWLEHKIPDSAFENEPAFAACK